MAVDFSDISFVYSGGISNSDPNASLGGDPSSYPITDILNNLFDNVLPSESTSGDTEYRAFYIFNDNNDYSMGDTKIWIDSEINLGASVEIGVNLVNEIQKITITPQSSITGGAFKVRVTYQFGVSVVVEETVAIAWSANFDILAQNIETSLNNLNVFSEIQVAKEGLNAIFNVTFQESDGNKAQPTLTIIDNMLTSSGGSPQIDVELVVQGSPINNIAVDIGTENIPPTGITFTTPDSDDNSLEIGKLSPGQGFPVWIKRIVPAETEGLNLDGFTLRLRGSTPAT